MRLFQALSPVYPADTGADDTLVPAADRIASLHTEIRDAVGKKAVTEEYKSLLVKVCDNDICLSILCAN